MEKQVTFKGAESTDDLEARIATVQSKLEAVVPDARLAKYVVEAAPRAYAVGLVVTLANGDAWVRHAEGADWDRAFLEIERRIDRLAEGD